MVHSNPVRLNVLLLIILACVAHVKPVLISQKRHKVTNPFSSDAGNCGVIPKVKIHERSRDPGISSFGQIPWQAGIFDTSGNLICSGALLSSDVVLTSAVCLLGVEDFSALEIRLGDWDISKRDSPQEAYDHFSTSTLKVSFYPDVSMNQDERPSIILLVLKEPVDFHSYPHVSPICLPPLTFALDHGVHDYCLVSGWGSQNRQINSSEDTNDNSTEVSNKAITDHEPIIQTPYSVISNSLPDDTAGSIGSVSREKNSLEDVNSNVLTVISSPPVYKPRVDKTFKLPDPIEDYLDEHHEDGGGTHSADTAKVPSSHSRENTQDLSAEYKSPFLDSIYPITEHHEASLYRHKLKYKKGKARVNQNRISEYKIDDKVDAPHTKKKRSYIIPSEKRCFGKHRKRRLYQSHAEPEKATWLKLFKVKVHNNCAISDDSSDEPKGDYEHCISPTDGHYPMFPCMMDVGSPVFCTSDNSLRSGSKIDSNKKRNRHPLSQVSLKAYLIGFVNNGTPTCRGLDSPNSPDQHSKSVPITPFTADILTFIYQNI